MRSLHRLLALGLGVAGLLAILAVPARAGKTLTVPVRTFRPTQMELGKAASNLYLKGWRSEAAERGMSLKAFAADVLRPRLESTRVPVVIDPAGGIRNTDGHHRINALRQLERETGVRLELEAKLLKDYRGKSFEKYAEHFVGKLGKGQFTEAVDKLPVVERMKRLPGSYSGLRDSPMRSAVDGVFEKYKIDGGLMKDYIEFKVGRKLVDDGLLKDLRRGGVLPAGTRALPPRLALDERVGKAIEERLGSRRMRHFMLDEAASKESRKELKQRLRALRD